MITPGFEETYLTSPFHPAFLASLDNFTVLRFMDWMHANSGNTPEEWEPQADVSTKFSEPVLIQNICVDRFPTHLFAVCWS